MFDFKTWHHWLLRWLTHILTNWTINKESFFWSILTQGKWSKVRRQGGARPKGSWRWKQLDPLLIQLLYEGINWWCFYDVLQQGIPAVNNSPRKELSGVKNTIKSNIQDQKSPNPTRDHTMTEVWLRGQNQIAADANVTTQRLTPKFRLPGQSGLYVLTSLFASWVQSSNFQLNNALEKGMFCYVDGHVFLALSMPMLLESKRHAEKHA